MRRRARRQQGSILIAALVLIAILFFIETALAAAVSSTLHSVRVIDSQAGVRYAAESAAARGIAAGLANQACPPSGVINGITSSTTCFTVAGISDDTSSLEQWSTPDQSLGGGGCSVTKLPGTFTGFGGEEGGVSVKLWTVLAWRSSGAAAAGLSVWIDTTSTCTQQFGLCAAPLGLSARGAANLLAVTCPDGDSQYYLHLQSTGGPLEVGPFVVRGSIPGSDAALIAVGAAATELDEAEILLPASPPSGFVPIQDVWDTLLQ